MNNRIQFVAKSIEQMATAFATLTALGYDCGWAEYKTNPSKVVSQWFREFPALIVTRPDSPKDYKYFGANSSAMLGVPIAASFEELMNFALNIQKVVEPINVKLNASYTAVVGENNVQVGCQTFGFEVVDALKSAVDKQRAR